MMISFTYHVGVGLSKYIGILDGHNAKYEAYRPLLRTYIRINRTPTHSYSKRRSYIVTELK